MGNSFLAENRNAGFINGAAAIINVPDVEAALLWYQDELGLEIEFAWGDPIMHGGVRAGNTSFHFQAGDPIAPTTAYMTLYVNALDELFADISTRAVDIVAPPEVMPWGMRAFMVNDLNGALVMFADPSTGE